MKFSRAAYANLYGPTTGDRVRLGDTDLFLEIERDFAIYGEEVTFGGGKVIRDGQGQSQTTRAGGAPDLVITNAIVLDYWGLVKADVGVRDGRICAIGKAGNPDIQDNVTPGLAIGPSTEIIAGQHRTGFWHGAHLSPAPESAPTAAGTLVAFAQSAPGLVYLRALGDEGPEMDAILRRSVEQVAIEWGPVVHLDRFRC